MSLFSRHFWCRSVALGKILYRKTIDQTGHNEAVTQLHGSRRAASQFICNCVNTYWINLFDKNYYLNMNWSRVYLFSRLCFRSTISEVHNLLILILWQIRLCTRNHFMFLSQHTATKLADILFFVLHRTKIELKDAILWEVSTLTTEPFHSIVQHSTKACLDTPTSYFSPYIYISTCNRRDAILLIQHSIWLILNTLT